MLPKNRNKLSLLMLLPSATLAGGPIESPAPPEDFAMYSLDDICNRLATGAVGTKLAFTEPTSGPQIIGCSLNEMMDKAPAKDNSNGAQPGDVAAGKKYWGVTDGNWGPQIGTGVAKGDPNLAPENIRAGVTIFGITGTFTGTTSTPPSSSGRYTDNGDGTVTDNGTGLIWLKNANCYETQTWENAMQSAANLASGQCGLSDGSSRGDWRLPTKEELEAMTDTSYDSPALSNAAGTGQWSEGDAFVGVQSNWYWSSSTRTDSADLVLGVNLDDGRAVSGFKHNTPYVWPVRSGHSCFAPLKL